MIILMNMTSELNVFPQLPAATEILLETQTAAAAAACDELDARIIIHGHLHDCESAIGMEGNGKSLASCSKPTPRTSGTQEVPYRISIKY